MNKTYKDLIVWQKSVDLVIMVYELTGYFPQDEKYGLVSQMRRAAVSIPSNIAEGKLRGYDKECRQFFLMSFASGGELETQIEIAKRLPITKSLDYGKIEQLLVEIMKILNTLINQFSSKA